LRIALSTLAHEGFLVPRAAGGFVVREFTRQDVDDAIELRGVLEGTAARFAAERLDSPSELTSLEAITAELDVTVANPSPPVIAARYAALNEAFHRQLAHLAKSRPLERALANLLAPSVVSPNASLESPLRRRPAREMLIVAQHQHRMVIEAVRAGHGTRAEEIAREHARLAQFDFGVRIDDRAARPKNPDGDNAAARTNLSP
jgi:GntR family transcriptional regulator of vanillate catabolism